MKISHRDQEAEAVVPAIYKISIKQIHQWNSNINHIFTVHTIYKPSVQQHARWQHGL